MLFINEINAQDEEHEGRVAGDSPVHPNPSSGTKRKSRFTKAFYGASRFRDSIEDGGPVDRLMVTGIPIHPKSAALNKEMATLDAVETGKRMGAKGEPTQRLGTPSADEEQERSRQHRKRFGVQSRISPHWTRHSLGHILYAQPIPRRDERGISSLLLSMPSYATTDA